MCFKRLHLFIGAYALNFLSRNGPRLRSLTQFTPATNNIVPDNTVERPLAKLKWHALKWKICWRNFWVIWWRTPSKITKMATFTYILRGYICIYIHIYVVTVLIEIVFVIVSQKPARWLWGAFASVVILLAIGVFSSFIASISSTLNTLRMSRVENSKHLDWWNGWRKQCPVSIPVKNNSPNILLMDQNPGFYSPVEVGR